jgi:hypothetical protein
MAAPSAKADPISMKSFRSTARAAWRTLRQPVAIIDTAPRTAATTIGISPVAAARTTPSRIEARHGRLADIGKIAGRPFHQEYVAVGPQAGHGVSGAEQQQYIAGLKADFAHAGAQHA